MATFAQMPTMDVWYAHLDEDERLAAASAHVRRQLVPPAQPSGRTWPRPPATTRFRYHHVAGSLYGGQNQKAHRRSLVIEWTGQPRCSHHQRSENRVTGRRGDSIGTASHRSSPAVLSATESSSNSGSGRPPIPEPKPSGPRPEMTKDDRFRRSHQRNPGSAAGICGTPQSLVLLCGEPRGRGGFQSESYPLACMSGEG